MQQAQGDAGVSGVHERSLTLDQHNLRLAVRLESKALGGTGNEIRHDGVDGDSGAGDEDPRLAGGGEGSGDTASGESAVELERYRHLAGVAVGADGKHAERSRPHGAAPAHWDAGRRLAQVEELAAARLR